MPSGVAPNRFRAVRRTGLGYAMFPRFPRRSRFGPTQGQSQNALLAFGVCHSALLFVGPARHRRGRRFPSASGFGRFPPFAGERKTLTNP